MLSDMRRERSPFGRPKWASSSTLAPFGQFEDRVGNCGADAGIVGHRAILHRQVEIDADQRALPARHPDRPKCGTFVAHANVPSVIRRQRRLMRLHGSHSQVTRSAGSHGDHAPAARRGRPVTRRGAVPAMCRPCGSRSPIRRVVPASARDEASGRACLPSRTGRFRGCRCVEKPHSLSYHDSTRTRCTWLMVDDADRSNERLVRIGEDALQRAFRCSLEQRVDFVPSCRASA
jgi:hypothetical protein